MLRRMYVPLTLYLLPGKIRLAQLASTWQMFFLEPCTRARYAQGDRFAQMPGQVEGSELTSLSLDTPKA